MTARTVAVDLVAKVAGYKREMASAGRSTKDFKQELDAAARAGEKSALANQLAARSAGELGDAATGAGDSAHGAGDDFTKMAKDAGFLDKRLGELRGELKGLLGDFDKTGDADLLKKIGATNRELGQISRLKSQLGGLAGETQDKVVPAAKKASDGLERFGYNAKILDHRVKLLHEQLRVLAVEFNRTGDVDILRNIKSGTGELDQLKRIKKMLAELGDAGGKGMAGNLIESFSKALSAGGSTVVGAVVGAVALAAPFLGASISAAVLGGVGAGGIIGGIAAASRDPRVRSEAQELGKTFSAAADIIGQPFIGPTIEALQILNKETVGWATDLRQGLAAVAPVLKPLTEGLDGFVDKTMPGLVKGLETAKPILRSLSRDLPHLGEDLSDMFSSMAEHPEAATAAMHDLVTIIGQTARGIGNLTEFLSSYYEVLIKTGEVTTGWANDLPKWVKQITPLAAVADYFDGNVEAMKKASDASHDFRDVTQQVTTVEYRFGSALQGTTGDLEAQRNAMLNLVDTHLDLRRSTQEIEEAIDSFSESVDENGRSLDITTEKGRNNRAAIEASIDALRRGEQAAYDNALANGATGIEAEEAAKRYHETYIPALVDAAVKAGFNRDQVAALYEILNKLDGRRITYTLVQRGGRTIGAKVDSGFIPAGNTDDRRWGGINYAMSRGGSIEAHYATSPTVLYGERETGGEAFIPRFGDTGRSLAILNRAAGWYGHTLAPGAGGAQASAQGGAFAGGGATTVIVQLIDPMSGKVLRQTAINDATARGVAPEKIRTAYP